MRQLCLCILALPIVGLAGCWTEPTVEDTSELARVEQATHFKGAAYLWRTPSSSPGGCQQRACLGFLLSAVNLPATTCSDGSSQSECRVNRIDFSAVAEDVSPLELTALLYQDDLEVRLTGDIVAARRGPPGDILEASGVFVAVAPGPAEGALYSIEGNIIGCNPECEVRAELLNTSVSIELQGLDFRALDLDRDALAAANAAAALGLLLVAGEIDGLVLRATQLLETFPGTIVIDPGDDQGDPSPTG